MDGKSLNASLAYVQALKRSAHDGLEGGDKVGSAAHGGPSFAELLSGIAEDVVSATKQSELMSVKAAAKQVELVDVITGDQCRSRAGIRGCGARPGGPGLSEHHADADLEQSQWKCPKYWTWPVTGSTCC